VGRQRVLRLAARREPVDGVPGRGREGGGDHGVSRGDDLRDRERAVDV